MCESARKSLVIAFLGQELSQFGLLLSERLGNSLPPSQRRSRSSINPDNA